MDFLNKENSKCKGSEVRKSKSLTGIYKLLTKVGTYSAGRKTAEIK